MKAVRPVIASDAVSYLQMRSVGSHSMSEIADSTCHSSWDSPQITIFIERIYKIMMVFVKFLVSYEYCENNLPQN